MVSILVDRPRRSQQTAYRNTMTNPQPVSLAEGSPLCPGSAMVDIAETIQSGCSDRGGWNKPQLALIGVEWPPVHGWRTALEASGLRVPRELHDRFVALRGLLGRAAQKLASTQGPSEAMRRSTPEKAA